MSFGIQTIEIDSVDDVRLDYFVEAIRHGYDVMNNATRETIYLALEFAAGMNDAEVVRLIIDHLDVMIEDEDGFDDEEIDEFEEQHVNDNKAYRRAFFVAWEKGHVKIMELLTSRTWWDTEQLLYEGVDMQLKHKKTMHIDGFKFLLEKACPRVKDEVLQSASRMHCPELISLLVPSFSLCVHDIAFENSCRVSLDNVRLLMPGTSRKARERVFLQGCGSGWEAIVALLLDTVSHHAKNRGLHVAMKMKHAGIVALLSK